MYLSLLLLNLLAKVVEYIFYYISIYVYIRIHSSLKRLIRSWHISDLILTIIPYNCRNTRIVTYLENNDKLKQPILSLN